VTAKRLGWQSASVDGVELYQRVGRFDVGSPQVSRDSQPFLKVVGFWAPRRWLSPDTMVIDGLVAEIEETVRTRGFIASDGQVLTTLARVEPWDATFEVRSIDTPLDIPDRRPWGEEQRVFFGVESPYQMADDAGPFTWSSISVTIADPYLSPGELIAGVVDGVKDGCEFTCPCHYATVVYTTRHRLVCMMCGATHRVFRDPVLTTFRQTITADDWRDLFDPDGRRRHESVDLLAVDVQDVEAAPVIWSTDQWDEALHLFILLARTPRDEFLRRVRNTELDPDLGSMLLEDGWTPIAEAPSPAFQLHDASLDIDLVSNAEHAFRDGVEDFLAAYIEPRRLVGAVPSLFRAVELLLKTRLELLDPKGLDDQPNNPAVLARLRAGGVSLLAAEVETISQLRLLRNRLQHGTAQFNPRAGLSLCRETIAFIDRFADDELGIWTGDAALPASQWQQLLSIESVAERALRIATARVEPSRSDPDAHLVECPECEQETLIRPRPNAGAICVYCGYVPITPDE